jgi:hypothetical protein
MIFGMRSAVLGPQLGTGHRPAIRHDPKLVPDVTRERKHETENRKNWRLRAHRKVPISIQMRQWAWPTDASIHITKTIKRVDRTV